MKRTIILLIPVIALIFLSACSETAQEKGDIFVGEVDYITITDSAMNEVEIDDDDVIDMMSHYEYVDKWDQDRINDLFLYPGTRNIKVFYKKGNAECFFLLRNGDIVMGSDQDLGNLRHYVNNENSTCFDEEHIQKIIAKFGGEEYDLDSGELITAD